MDHDTTPRADPSRKRKPLIVAGIVAALAIIVLLHLTGVVKPHGQP